MDNLIKVDFNPITVRSCPECGYLEAQDHIEMLIVDVSCFECEETTLSQFVPSMRANDMSSARNRLRSALEDLDQEEGTKS